MPASSGTWLPWGRRTWRPSTPWEGFLDVYREVFPPAASPKRGSRRTGRCSGWAWQADGVEDWFAKHLEHPLPGTFWESKHPGCGAHRHPRLRVRQLGDQGLHTRGTLEGFRRLTSDWKRLEVHGEEMGLLPGVEPRTPTGVLRAFPKGLPTEVSDWPTVRAFLRQEGTRGSWVPFDDWPPPQTRWWRLYPNPEWGTLEDRPPAGAPGCWYLGLGGARDRTGHDAAGRYSSIRFPAPRT